MAVVDLPGGSRIVFEAVDAASGLAVSGVTVSAQAVTAIDTSDDALPPKSPAPSPVKGAYFPGEV